MLESMAERHTGTSMANPHDHLGGTNKARACTWSHTHIHFLLSKTNLYLWDDMKNVHIIFCFFTISCTTFPSYQIMNITKIGDTIALDNNNTHAHTRTHTLIGVILLHLIFKSQHFFYSTVQCPAKLASTHTHMHLYWRDWGVTTLTIVFQLQST